MVAIVTFSLAAGLSSGAQVAVLLAKALLLVAVLFGVFSAVVCCWAIVQQVLIGALLIAIYAIVTCPRKQVCPW